MILITGAGSGLGAALAKLYHHDQSPLILSGRSEAKLVKVKNQHAQSALIVSANLANSEDVSLLLDTVAKPEQPPLTRVIHCAGSGLFGPVETQKPTDIAQLINNNLTSTIFLLRELVLRYKHAPVEVVIVMSTAAQTAKSGESTYCAVKWAVKGLVESVRMELKGFPMRITAVYPGGMATNFWATSGKQLDTSGFMTAEEAAVMLKQALLSTEHGYVSDITINRQ